MSAARLFELEPVALAPEPPAPSPARVVAPAARRKRARRPPLPLRVLKVRCQHRCGFEDKIPINGGLERFGELSTCPGCRRVASIEVVAFQTR